MADHISAAIKRRRDSHSKERKRVLYEVKCHNNHCGKEGSEDDDGTSFVAVYSAGCENEHD